MHEINNYGEGISCSQPCFWHGGVGAGVPARLGAPDQCAQLWLCSGFGVFCWFLVGFGSSFLPAQADVDISGLSLSWDVLKSPPLPNYSQSGGFSLLLVEKTPQQLLRHLNDG